MRSRNEDVYWTRPDLRVCGVSDGMGGLDAGHIAARMTADEITQAIRESDEPQQTPEHLDSIIRQANREIHARASALPDVRAMGATLVMVYFSDSMAYVCHAGDSRAYLLRDEKLLQLTRDHNLVNEKFENGEITQAEADAAPQDSRITRCIGPSQVLRPTINELPIQAKDLIMLCSDGLTGFVDNETLSETMNQYRANTNVLLDKLIDAASDHGSTDNITVVLAEITG